MAEMNNLKKSIPSHDSVDLLNTQMVEVLGKLKNLQDYAFCLEKSSQPEAKSSKTSSACLSSCPCFRLTEIYDQILLDIANVD